MKINKLKYMFAIIFIFMMFITIEPSCASTVDLSAKGNIKITLKKTEPVKNAEITIYKIANAEIKNSNLTFSYVDELQEFDVEVDKLDNKEAVANLIEYISGKNIEKIVKTTDEEGTINFENVTTGLYLVVQTKGVTGYYNINSFLISMPRAENGEWTYNVDSTPKVGVKPGPSERPPVPEKPDDPDDDKKEENNPVEEPKKEESKPAEPVKNNSPENKENVLIKTGQNNWPIVIFSAVGVICIIIGIAIKLRKDDNEN